MAVAAEPSVLDALPLPLLLFEPDALPLVEQRIGPVGLVIGFGLPPMPAQLQLYLLQSVSVQQLMLPGSFLS